MSDPALLFAGSLAAAANVFAIAGWYWPASICIVSCITVGTLVIMAHDAVLVEDDL
jgi:hypothetical protein